ncbi:hypothetical protein OIU77_008212, partial [Salix suchowensis]
MRIFSCFADL